MDCKVDGCGMKAKYKGDQLCQKHYFRIRRNGVLELKPKSRKYRTQNPAGYQKLYEPTHPLVNSDGYVYEHRMVVWSVCGKNLPACEICGRATDWATCHIDHRDDDVTHNAPSNLRPLCAQCNIKRTAPPIGILRWNATTVIIDGKSLTPHEWSKKDGVLVSGATIRRRKQMGASDFDAVYATKKTHKGKR